MKVIFSRGETLKGGVMPEFKTVDSNYFILFSHLKYHFSFVALFDLYIVISPDKV